MDNFREWPFWLQNRAKTNTPAVVFLLTYTYFKPVIVMYILLFLAFLACTSSQNSSQLPPVSESSETSQVAISDTIAPPRYDAKKQLIRVSKTDAEWQKSLSELEYQVLRQKGTERAFTGDLLKVKHKGTFTCRGCGLPLFSTKAKFESGTGWPSFWEPYGSGLVAEHQDESYGMVRTEVTCARCGGHLGHVFDDGPKPTGLRYCINSVSLDFVPE